MNVTVIGSHLCPDTVYALCELRRAGANIEFKNLSASLADLKAYLALRESEPLYDAVRQGAVSAFPALCWKMGKKRWIWARCWPAAERPEKLSKARNTIQK